MRVQTCGVSETAVPKVRGFVGKKAKTRERKMMDNYGKQEKKRNEDKKKKKVGETQRRVRVDKCGEKKRTGGGLKERIERGKEGE